MREQFNRQGYVMSPVLSAGEVKELRSIILETYKKLSSSCNFKRRYLNATDVIRHEKILLTSVNKKIIQILKEILEDNYTIIPDFQVQVNMYGSLIGKSNGWHLDCNSEIPNSYLFDDDYAFVKCGIYLQDNAIGYGGAVDMMPGAHKFPIRTGNNKLDFKLKSLFMRLSTRLVGRRMNIRAGDFVAFDSRLPHRSTPPGLKVINMMSEEEKRTGCLDFLNLPEENTKLVIYFNACRSAYANSFMENSCSRFHRQEFEKMNNETFFSNYLQLTYPDDFPASFVDLVKNEALNVATIMDENLKLKCKEYLMQRENVAA